MATSRESPTPPENQSRPELEASQLARLQTLIGAVWNRNAFWTQKWQAAGLSGEPCSSLEEFREWPFLTKAELVEDQAAHPPYGTNLTFDVDAYSRLHQTSGTTGQPLRCLDTPETWNWWMGCWQQIYRIAGIDAHDRFYFPFSFGPFIGFWSAFEGAARLGALCIPGGGASSSARLKMIADNDVTIVCCTPTYALRLAEVAQEEGVDLAAGSVRALVVAGEPGGSIASIKRRIEEAWGARMFDHWGMTELGPFGIECAENPGGLHMLESECIAEVLDQESLEPVAPGGQGELVVTNLGRTGAPLFRYRTGDLVEIDTAPCPCGRALLRLKGGILGRADDMVTIRGNNVFPSSVEAILREFDEIAEFRIEVRTERSMQAMTIQVEPLPELADVESLLARVAGAIKDRLNFQAAVVAVEPDSLPRFELKGRRFWRVG